MCKKYAAELASYMSILSSLDALRIGDTQDVLVSLCDDEKKDSNVLVSQDKK